MKKFVAMTISLLTLFTTLLLSCTSTNGPDPDQQMKKELENLLGTYVDETPYPYGAAFGQRIFTFNEGHWTLVFTLGLDPNLEQQVFEFRTFGTYDVLDKSTIVDNTFNALFLEEQKYLTLKTDNPDLAQAFGFAECGLIKDQEKDISLVGCSAWAAVAICNEDHDLLSLDQNGLLYFGERPADNNMCTADRRPQSLTPGVKKIN